MLQKIIYKNWNKVSMNEHLILNLNNNLTYVHVYINMFM